MQFVRNATVTLLVMFTADGKKTPDTRTPRLAASVWKHTKVGVAVAAAVIAIPFTTSAEPRPFHDGVIVNPDAQTDSQSVSDSAARPGDIALLDACPIDGAGTFEDSWGWARSGGRRHEGVDIIAARGVPILAVRDGIADFTTSNLGGRAIWLTADNGDRFYYAHLDTWEGESRVVTAGEVIGYVGSSGNARGSHLHFETMPQGTVENPFPHTLRACVPPPPPIVNEIAQTNSSAALARNSVVRNEVVRTADRF